MPYLSHFTYKYHAERARVAGLRVEDTYDQKFFREPYITWHIFAQYFHPNTLTERIRNVNVYRKTNTLFKGFSVPDWARSSDSDGFDMDIYSRMAWKNAMNDMKSEWTPMQFSGERLEPQPLQWFRHEHWGKGHSSRFFYNEVPNPAIWRHGGRLENKEKVLYSFKYADQDSEDLFGFDTSNPEGREQLKEEVRRWKAMCPEVFREFEVDDNYETKPYLSEEPHFKRVWGHYRQFQFNSRVHYLIEQGDLSVEDIRKAKPFFDANGLPSASMYSLAQRGLLGDVSNEPSFQSFTKILKWLGLDNVEFDNTTSQPHEEQFWNQFDNIFDLRESEMEEHLQVFITDPRHESKIAAIRDGTYEIGQERTDRLV